MFAKVVEERSFAAAARTMDVSVATVSRAVGRLEERLGARLFNRTSRQLALTEFGRTIAESATRIYHDAEQVEGIARELSVQPRGLIKLAVPMSFGLKWVAPILPDFLAAYPDVSIDLHLSDATVDLVGDGFDAALRIAVLPDSSLVARKLCPVSRRIVAAPAYLEKHGRPRHPGDVDPKHCLGYAYRARNDVWRLVNKEGKQETIVPEGRLRVTNSDAMIPAILAGLAVAELPDFIASEFLSDGRLKVILTDWSMEEGGLYFVTPSARSRPAKVEVLARFFMDRLANPEWMIGKAG